jgi:hypothetical protein
MIITIFLIDLVWGFLKDLFVFFSFSLQKASQKNAFPETNSEFSKFFFIIGVQVQRLVLFLVFRVFLINPLIAFASTYSDGMNAM